MRKSLGHGEYRDRPSRRVWGGGSEKEGRRWGVGGGWGERAGRGERLDKGLGDSRREQGGGDWVGRERGEREWVIEKLGGSLRKGGRGLDERRGEWIEVRKKCEGEGRKEAR